MDAPRKRDREREREREAILVNEHSQVEDFLSAIVRLLR